MESEENGREQSPGSASHGGGKVCHRCGWVFPNPHPSKKHRSAHRKHCGAVGSKPADDAADVDGDGDEDPRNMSGEVVVEESKSQGEEGSETGQSGGGGEELPKDAILETDPSDISPESHALHHDNNDQGSDVESTARLLDDSTHLDNHSVPYGVDKVCTTEDTKSSSHSPLTRGSCMDAAKEELDCATVHNVVDSATVQNVVDSATVANNLSIANGVDKVCTTEETESSSHSPSIKGSSMDASKEELDCATLRNVVYSATVANNLSIGNYVEDKLDLHIPKAVILPHDSSSNSSFASSELQKIDEFMEFGVNVNQMNTETTLMSGLPQEVSANTVEPESFICNAQDEKTNAVGKTSKVQPYCNVGLCTLDINASENFDTSIYSSRCDFQIDESANSLVNENEPEDWHTFLVASSTLLVEASKMKPASLEDSQLVEPDLTKISADAEVGCDSDRHTVDVPKVVSTELLVVESDKIADSIPSTLLVNEGFSLHKENVNAIETNKSNDVHNFRDVKSDRSHLINEFKCEMGVSMMRSDSPKEESDWLITNQQVACVGSSEDQAIDLHGRFTNACETCYSLTELEAHKTDCLSEGKDSNLSYEGTSADNLSVPYSAFTVSSVSQYSITSEICVRSQIVCQEAIQDNNDVVVEEKKDEMVTEQGSYMDPKVDSQPEGYATELKLLPGEDIERTELRNDKDLVVSGGVLISKHEETSSRNIDGISGYCLDQTNVHETCEETFKQPAVVDETTDHSDRQEEPLVEESIAENGFPGKHYDKLDPHKDETNNMETIYGSQLELQNVLGARSVDPMSSDKNNPINLFLTEIDHIPNAEKENSLPNILEKETNSNKHNGVGLCNDNEGIPKTEECSTSKADAQSFIGKLASDYESKTSDALGVAPSISYQSSKEEDIHDDSMQQTDSYIGKIDDSIYSNSHTGSIEALWGSVSDGAIHATEEVSNFDVKTSLPRDSLDTKDLCNSDLVAEGAFHKSSVRNNDILEETSLKPPVEPGRQSVSIENKSVHNSKHEPEGRNTNEETSAKVLNWNPEKPHVMLKNLLAEANLESEQKATNGQGQNASLTSKRNWGLHDVGHSLKTATSRIVSDQSNGSLGNQADHTEWNSPARLPVTKHEKKKVKGKQAWVPFICCPSMN